MTYRGYTIKIGTYPDDRGPLGAAYVLRIVGRGTVHVGTCYGRADGLVKARAVIDRADGSINVED